MTYRMVRVTNHRSINALSVCELLVELASSAGRRPITGVLDNARYQRCALVQETAEVWGIELRFLPSYSPHQSDRASLEVRQEAVARQ